MKSLTCIIKLYTPVTQDIAGNLMTKHFKPYFCLFSKVIKVYINRLNMEKTTRQHNPDLEKVWLKAFNQ